MTAVTVSTFTYTHSVTYVADNILKSLKNVLRLSGLDPTKLTDDWQVLTDGMSTWMGAQELERVTLEIFDPITDALVTRWDIDIQYGWASDDGNVWTDTDQLAYAIKKAGVSPASAKYRVLLRNKPGARQLPGWTSTPFRSTDGMVRQSLGSTVQHGGLGGNTSYWRTA